MDRERKLKLIAVDKTIEYALQQGIKLRRSDFELELDYTSKELNLVQINHMLSGEQGVSVILRAVNRWKSMLLKKKESFLNYANARLINQDIVFQFSFRELNFFEMNQEPEEIDGKSMEKILSKIDRLLALADLDKNSNEHEAIAASMKKYCGCERRKERRRNRTCMCRCESKRFYEVERTYGKGSC